jgi:hypothetical protein
MSPEQQEAAHAAAEAQVGKVYPSDNYPKPCRYFRASQHEEARAFMWALGAIVAPRGRAFLCGYGEGAAYGYYTEIVEAQDAR